MTKKDLVSCITSVLREKNIRKPVYAQKHVLHVSDDDGNSKDFIIKKKDTAILFTKDDVEKILDACIGIIEDSLKRGEEINIRGFGTLAVHHRKARSTIHPVTGEYIDVEARYIPKFTFGNELRMCAKVYELSLNDRAQTEVQDMHTSVEDGE